MSNKHLQVVTQEHPLEAEIDFEEEFIHDDDDLSSDSDVAIVTLDQATDAIDSSYLVKKHLGPRHTKYFDKQYCDKKIFR